MHHDDNLQQCYNRGCGQRYDPSKNSNDSCQFHPGNPVFHDVYKGWSCCNKKCIDFTEFLNIKGCAKGLHSNIKPPEPEKPKANIPDTEIIDVKPVAAAAIARPSFDSAMTTIEPEIAPSLKTALNTIEQTCNEIKSDHGEIKVGTNCKNGGCTTSYQGPESNSSICLHHPGLPIFHEGLKYWSCCQRKTTDFNNFLNQEGCKEGNHTWKKESDNDETKVQCRWDHHQTGPFIVVSIYAKQYSPSKSVVKLNPIRLYTNLVFPQQNNANFELDVELTGVIDVENSKVTMYGTKVEIQLKKAEIGKWSKLEAKIITKQPSNKEQPEAEKIVPQFDAVDLSDL